MAALSADRQVQFESGDMQDLPVLANTVIYAGAFVGDNGSGLMRGLVAGDPFRGIAIGKSGATVSASGDYDVRVLEVGKIVHAVTGVADEDDVGEIVYASDDQTLTLTSTSNTAIGRVVRHISSTTCCVRFQAQHLQDQA